MRLTARERYAVRAMASLATAYGAGPVPLAQVADSQKIPLRYLEHIAQDLRRSGLVCSRRGAAGGYQLATPPEHITVADIFHALEGEMLPMACGDPSGCSFSDCVEVCAAKPLWDSLRHHLERSLTRVTLAELAKRLGSQDAGEGARQNGD